MMTQALKDKIITITEGSKFFGFMEKMTSEGITTGTLKLKDGTRHKFCYITDEIIEGKKTFYIHIH